MTGNEAVKQVIEDRSQKMREAIEYDVRRKTELLMMELPESAKKHMRHKPYALDWGL